MAEQPGIKIYFNPECSKCVSALDILHQHGAEPEIVEYLSTVPSKGELKELLAMLRMKPFELIRTNENLFQQKFEGKNYSDDEWLDIMLEHPELIQRPIVISGGKAVIGRPPEKVLDLLKL